MKGREPLVVHCAAGLRAPVEEIAKDYEAAYGVPVLSTDTGGVSGIVQNGVNGFLLPPEAPGAEYAKVLAELFESPDRYRELREASRAAYDERLNWDAFGRSAARILAGGA